MPTPPTPYALQGQVLDDDEARVAQAQRRLTQLAAALVSTPMDRKAHEDMRDFLATESGPALDSWEVLLSRTPEELRERIHAVLTARTVRRVS